MEKQSVSTARPIISACRVSEKDRQKLGESRGARNFFSLRFLRFPRTFEGSDPSQGEEANRWHCAVSGGAQPFWRPGMGCPNAGKALHFGEVSPHAEAQAKPHRGEGPTALHLPLAQGTVQSRYVCTQPWDIVNRKKEAEPPSKPGQCYKSSYSHQGTLFSPQPLWQAQADRTPRGCASAQLRKSVVGN